MQWHLGAQPGPLHGDRLQHEPGLLLLVGELGNGSLAGLHHLPQLIHHLTLHTLTYTAQALLASQHGTCCNGIGEALLASQDRKVLDTGEALLASQDRNWWSGRVEVTAQARSDATAESH